VRRLYKKPIRWCESKFLYMLTRFLIYLAQRTYFNICLDLFGDNSSKSFLCGLAAERAHRINDPKANLSLQNFYWFFSFKRFVTILSVLKNNGTFQIIEHLFIFFLLSNICVMNIPHMRKLSMHDKAELDQARAIF
jgi:hypothetical protein